MPFRTAQEAPIASQQRRNIDPRRIEQVHPQWGDALERGHIIAAIRSMETLAAAAKASTETVYLLFGNPLTIPGMLQTMRDHGKLPLVNLDLLAGFSRDSINAEYLAHYGAAGVVSTHSDVLAEPIRQAIERGWFTTYALSRSAP